MLKQFRRQFPQGSFTSELLMVDHGLYLVRSLIQVEEVILSSGLAAASKLEEAEDQARLRALEHLALDQISLEAMTVLSDGSPTVPRGGETPTPDAEVSPPVVTSVSQTAREEKIVVPPLSVSIPEPEPILETLTEPSPPPKKRAAKKGESPTLAITPEPLQDLVEKPEKTVEPAIALEEVVEPVELAIAPEEIEEPVEPSDVPETATLPQLELISESEPSLFTESTELVKPEIAPSPPVSPSPEPTLILEPEITPSLPSEPTLSLVSEVSSPPSVSTSLETNQPIDFSEVIARSNVELKRLGWTNEQGKNYLLQTYGKRSRQLLSDEELLEFVLYLEAQPNPS